MAGSTVLPLVESIKKSLQNSSLCSTDTVTTLHRLLEGPAKNEQLKETTRTKRTVSVTAKPKPARSANAKGTGKVTIFQSPTETDTCTLSKQEKLSLATEVFNRASKLLSEHIKAQRPTNAVETKSKRVSIRETPTKTPLQITSPNRKIQSPVKPKSIDKQLKKRKSGKYGVAETAECARLALSTLRGLRSSDEKDGNNQLDQGLSILIGKLLALGLNEMALQELWVLKESIETAMENEVAGRQTKRRVKTTKTAGSRTTKGLDDLVKFTSTPKMSASFQLFVTFHSHALKAIAAESDASTIQAVHDMFKTSNRSSLANVITSAYDNGIIPADKAAQQLQSLSQNILSLSFACPMSDSKASSSSTRAKSAAILSLQILSLEMRCLWWKISKHRCDEVKELWEPLSRYVRAFSRRNPTIRKSDFDSVKGAFLQLKARMGSSGTASRNNDTLQSSMLMIMKTLGQLAYSAGCLDDAAEFCETTFAYLAPAQTAQLAVCQCTKALLQVESLRSSKCPLTKAIASVCEAGERLTAPLKGSQNELDELLMESAKLKKTIMKYISSVTEALDETIFSKIRQTALVYLTNFVRFLNRYLSSSSPSGTDTGSNSSLDQQYPNCNNIALAAVDSATVLSKLPATVKTTPWEEFDSLLYGCFNLCRALDSNGSSESSGNSRTDIVSRLLRISNLYWSCYLSRKDLGLQACELLPSVDRSIKVLINCSPTERLSGFMALKLERKASLYSEMGHRIRAEGAYASAIQEHLSAGVLTAASHSSATQHPRHIWKDPQSPAFALNRVTGYYLRSQLKREYESTLFFDDDGLETQERATLLEHQIFTVFDVLASNPSQRTTESIKVTVSTLLQLYSADIYPIRRSRVILRVLQFLLESNAYMGEEFPQFIIDEASSCLSSEILSEDKELQPFQDTILASLRLNIGFYLGDTPSADLEYVVQSWVKTIQLCPTWASIEARVGDQEAWIDQIRGLIDYLDVKGLWKLRISAIAVLNQIYRRQETRDFSMMVECSSTMAVQYNRLGYTEKAGYLLSKSKAIIEQQDISPPTRLAWYLASAEWRLEVGDYINSAKMLSAAKAIFETTSADYAKAPFQARVVFERFIVDACYILSRLAFAQGQTHDAIFYAKRAVKSSSRLWARLEKYSGSKSGKPIAANGEAIPDSLADGIANLSLSSGESLEPETYAQGSIYWPHFVSHCAALLQLSRVSRHNGLFQDAIYYGEQALAVSESVCSGPLSTFVRAELGSYWLAGGQLQKGKDLLEEAQKGLLTTEDSIQTIILATHLTSLYTIDDEIEEAYNSLGNLCQTLLDLSSGDFVDSLDPFWTSDIESRMKQLSIKPNPTPGLDRPTRSRNIRPTRQTRQVAKPKYRPESPELPKQEIQTDISPFSQLRAEILQRQATLLLSSQHLTTATTLLDEAERLPKSNVDQVIHRVCRMQQLLAQSLQELAAHSAYCVLWESTISLPSIHAVENHQKEAQQLPKSCSERPSARRAKAEEGSKAISLWNKQSYSHALSEAMQSLRDLTPLSQYSSSKDCHNASYLSSRMSMLSFTTESTHKGPVGHNSTAFTLELARNHSMTREYSSIVADKELSGHIRHPEWPSSPNHTTDGALIESSHFIENYVDILPSTWDIVSITLSPNCDEFIISKLRKGREPFLLCLPLKRGGDDDMDDESFGFNEGKEELLEIIQLANKSAHDSRAKVDRKAKKQWWSTREALDERLKELLDNIETVWLGGFRGVFAQTVKDSACLDSFADQFQVILDKHLPSRQSRRGKSPISKPTFDQWVMELFFNIGSLDDERNPEDSLMDLLYFAVDILQFQGEQNAYDEIDFDMMAVETLDALRDHEQRAKREQGGLDTQRHTILILDKSLHSFPWESLDCLSGSSISRMPSLHCVRERVMQLKKGCGRAEISAGFSIDRTNGSYILNPGGDLKSTQKTLEAPLSAFDGWTNIVQREPSEEEFEEALATKDLLLYFGHGSGAQYIRGRTIRRLDKCAVTFLMGCSSGAMTEAGEFEPYGTPWNYMHAGSPALVATLWDVTDKDIDRFAKAAFEEWGLLSKTVAEGSTKKNLFGIKKLGSLESQARVGLDTAVSKSREVCILKYLNGAAPVVYGVPVFLD